MKWDHFRRSENLEDYRDPKKKVENKVDPSLSLNEMRELAKSQLAKDLKQET